jgi:hypothetical protein
MREAPFNLNGQRMIAAAVGDGAVFVNPLNIGGSESIESARYEDESWASVTGLDGDFAVVELASAGDTAVAGAVSCPMQCEDGGRIEFFLLGPKDSKWVPLDVDVSTSAYEPWVAPVQGRGERAVFNTDVGGFAIDSRGGVERVSSPKGRRAGSASIACLTDDRLLALNSAARHLGGEEASFPSGGPEPTDDHVVAVEALDLTKPTSWKALPSPAAAPPGAGEPICTGSGALMVGDDVETAFDLTANAWSVRAVEAPGPPRRLQSIPSATAVASDGTLYTVTTGMELLRRDTTGTWSSIGPFNGALLATADEVLQVPVDATDVSQVP